MELLVDALRVDRGGDCQCAQADPEHPLLRWCAASGSLVELPDLDAVVPASVASLVLLPLSVVPVLRAVRVTVFRVPGPLRLEWPRVVSRLRCARGGSVVRRSCQGHPRACVCVLATDTQDGSCL